MPTLTLVRHGRPVIDRSRPAHAWALDPAYADDVRALRERLDAGAAALRGEEPHLEWWAGLSMPDVVRYPVGEVPGDMLKP